MVKVIGSGDVFKIALEDTEKSLMPADKQIPTNDLKHLKRAYMDDLDDTPINSPSVDSQATETPSTDNTNRIETLRYDLRESERKRKLEAESSDTWRTKYRFADAELQKRDIEVTNLKFEIERMNKLLEAAHAKDALMDGVMKLYLDTKAKLIDSVEGEVSDKWR